MGRTPRIFDPESVYHVVNRGNNKQRVFFSPKDSQHFLRCMARVKEKFGVEFFHYCLMPNHVHLLLRPNADLSAAMHGLFMPFAKWFCKFHGRTGHVWQGPFRPTAVLTDAHLYASGNYIEMNPVRANLAPTPGAWKHSSYRHYAYGEPNALITRSPFFENLGADEPRRRTAYRKNIADTRAS